MCSDIKYYMRLWKKQALERKEQEQEAEKRFKMYENIHIQVPTIKRWTYKRLPDGTYVPVYNFDVDKQSSLYE